MIQLYIPVICDDKYHPAETVVKGLEPLISEGTQFGFVANLDKPIETTVEGYPVVILCKSNIGSDNYLALVRYVRQGGGLLVIHSGIVGYKDIEPMLELTGGVFTHHPEQCRVAVDITQENVITRGCDNFSITDEHYFIEVHNPAIDTFITTTSQNGTQPGGWTIRHGKGRVCVLTPGHNLEVWHNPMFQSLVENSLSWCSGESGM